MEIQTEADPGLLYHWNLDGRAPYAALGSQYGLGYVDPAPIATHTISADALEGNTDKPKPHFFLLLKQKCWNLRDFLFHKCMSLAYSPQCQNTYNYDS